MYQSLTLRIKTLLFVIIIMTCHTTVGSQNRIIDFVNPMVGTKSMGHTFPGACAPFGLVQLSPDTEMVPHNIEGVYQKKAYEYCAGYQYEDNTIIGFSHTHFNGTGHSDLGDILIMPTTGEVKLEMGDADDSFTGYRSKFRHETEVAQPGYYSVMLDDYGIKAELTASKRTGVHRYTFPQGKGHIILDLSYGIYNYDGKVLMANLRVEDEYTLTGYRITQGWSRMNYTHFAIKFSKPILNWGAVDKDNPQYKGFWRRFNMSDNFPEMFGKKLTAFFDFDFTEGEELEIVVALSPVDCLGAMKNLTIESDGKSFDIIKTEVQKMWEEELSVIEVDDSDEKKRIFYTALYRTMINPSIYQDVDGRYRGIDHNIHQAEVGRENYTVFSVWDTYRAQHPLMNLIKREYSLQFVNSMLDHYSQSVHNMLPIWSHMGNENWCMIGYHSVSVLSDAIAKGLDIDPKLALKASYETSNVEYFDNIREYLQYGYIPFEYNSSSVSITLEYSYDDWAISQIAERAGNRTIYDQYLNRSQSYRAIFDPSMGFARPRGKNGEFKKNFNTLDTHGQGFIEGNSWNYSFYVPHNVNNLISLMGGQKRFVERLDSLFSMSLPAEYYENTEDINHEGIIGNYVHGNEPSHHIPYLYAWTDHVYKSQYHLHTIMKRMYRDEPDGLGGNDDCGQMSAWYIFSSMGFYPVSPGSDQYVLGTPNNSKTIINLENGEQFTVNTENLNDNNYYIKTVLLNGKEYKKAYITHSDIMTGGELTFIMDNKPNRKRKFKPEERPYSVDKE